MKMSFLPVGFKRNRSLKYVQFEQIINSNIILYFIFIYYVYRIMMDDNNKIINMIYKKKSKSLV